MKTYEINGKKYKVERVSADSKTQLIDRLVYLLIDLRNERLNSSNQGARRKTKEKKKEIQQKLNMIASSLAEIFEGFLHEVGGIEIYDK